MWVALRIFNLGANFCRKSAVWWTRRMGFKPLIWYCRPVKNGIWEEETHSAFGAYTPCAIDSVVIGISHLVLLGLCLYRVWLIMMNRRIRMFKLKSNLYNFILGLLSAYSAAEPLIRLIMGISLFNFHPHTGLAPFEVCDSVIFSSILASHSFTINLCSI